MSATLPPENYETAYKELEACMNQLENVQLPLEQALSLYQRGHVLIQYCQSQLQKAEQVIQVLENQTLKPWEDSDSHG